MDEYEVTLVVSTEYGDPAKWDWTDLIGEPVLVVETKQVGHGRPTEELER